MNAYEIIRRKRDGGELRREELRYIVREYVKGEIPDYQMSAFAMAVYFRGMSENELYCFTEAMRDSGERIDLSDIPGIKVDKHSSGGVGDKTTLVLAPMLAAAGLVTAKFSGRGLGHTGGTIDKLESIPGFRTSLETSELKAQLTEIGIAVSAASHDIDPADKKLYSLRDATATVESMPLIASSIMSKKLAIGSDILVLDVKVGRGAFMKTPEEARELSNLMNAIGRAAGKKTSCIISAMNEPLGYTVGNAIEVVEAIETLKGKGPSDLVELCVALGAEICELSGIAQPGEGSALMKKCLDSGEAYQRFRSMVRMQGGDMTYIDNPTGLLTHSYSVLICADRSGYLATLDAEEIGLAVKEMGGGRDKIEDSIDHGAGVVLAKKIGHRVEKGEVVARILAHSKVKGETAKRRIEKAFRISVEEQASPQLILDKV